MILVLLLFNISFCVHIGSQKKACPGVSSTSEELGGCSHPFFWPDLYSQKVILEIKSAKSSAS